MSIDRHGATLGHWIWVILYYSRKLSPLQACKRIIRRLTALNYSKISDVQVDGIDTRDYPDFADAFIASATYKGRPMRDAELDRLNSDSEYVYECVNAQLY
jgi:hypothetical protein